MIRIDLNEAIKAGISVYPPGASILSRLEAGRRWQGLEVSLYVCALAALHLPAAGRSSANSMLAGFRYYLCVMYYFGTAMIS